MNEVLEDLNMNWKLMTDDAITQEERNVLGDFVCNSSKITQGNVVRQFEEEWSKWLGCKYSVYVNSGSSANLLITRALSDSISRTKWISQACTWSTAVSPIIQFSNLQLCDVDLNNFGPDLENLEHIFKTQKPNYLLLTHLLGFPALSDELLELCETYDVKLVEDCCESHGAEFKGKKVGTHGIASSFSFYYGHHMTTIEGGMICTDDEDLYHEMLLLRSHGLLRELPKEEQEKRKSDKVDPLFTFLRDGFNVRNTDLHAKLGLMQLPHLDDSIKHRNNNFYTFIENLDCNLYKTDFNIEGCSNFAFPIFTKRDNLQQIKDKLEEIGVEYRPCIAGNLYEHPFMDKVKQDRFDKTANEIHKNCIYVGNHKDITSDMVKKLCEELNSI
jgi:CDP-4-dehydro-6-deoxyglucose reductase, E1|tara:strand:- start:2595 stop:3755 length:1161 start_codon:yes stop_codon:yes gene_type:complete